MAAPLPSIEAREAALLASYAMHSSQSAGREHAEPEHPYRGPFQRDRDRIVHSAAYRRLSAKTQVFTGELGDYHRTRLTHTLEVASVARTIGRALALNEDLIEALALVHDLGHPPFGHAGEDLLDDCLRDMGGFSHNAQALRIVRELETRYSEFPGLNLSREVLEGQQSRAARSQFSQSPLLEVQVVEAADSIAYDTHDADDALELGLVELDELLATELWSQAALRVKRRSSALDATGLRRAILHELIDSQVGDLLASTGARLARSGVDSPADVRQSPPLVLVSPELADQKKMLESFLRQRVYQHPDVLALRRQAQNMLRSMFQGYLAHSDWLPESFRRRAERDGLPRSVGDYLAGMTDRFAQREFERLFAPRTR
ncbi:MAG TPA: deoxyguanosinetriphosphate triphosphohydrolase [Pirellulales bacterium]|nr:deoxyguanosinetriphosphate triphosphohydrolase [Pirellulales bacterium]